MKKKLLPWPRGKRGENRITCTVPGLTNPCWSKGNTFPIAATHGSLNQWKRIGWEIGFPAWECHRWNRCTLVFLTIVLRLVVEKKLGKGTGSKGGPKRIEDICTPLSSHFLLFSFFSAFRSKYILNQVSFLDQFVSCFACRLKVAHLSKCGYFFHSWFHPFFFIFLHSPLEIWVVISFYFSVTYTALWSGQRGNQTLEPFLQTRWEQTYLPLAAQ